MMDRCCSPIPCSTEPIFFMHPFKVMKKKPHTIINTCKGIGKAIALYWSTVSVLYHNIKQSALVRVLYTISKEGKKAV